MDKQRPWRHSAVIRASKEERQYVLEDVFWVPARNLSSGRAAPHLLSEPGPEKVVNSEALPSNDSEKME